MSFEAAQNQGAAAASPQVGWTHFHAVENEAYSQVLDRTMVRLMQTLKQHTAQLAGGSA